jgi:hypothetical protein
MDSNDLVRRIHQQAQGGYDAEVCRAVAEFRAWRDAAYRLLANTRENLPAIVESSHQSLSPVFILQVREVGKGRKKTTVRETEPTVGWTLHTWPEQYGSYPPSRVTDFLLHDGRLLRAGQIRTGMQGSLLPDSAFLKILAQSGVRQQPDGLPVLQVFRSLFATTKLQEPNVPPRPEYSGQGTGTFQRSIGVGSKVKNSVFGDGIKIDSMMPSD